MAKQVDLLLRGKNIESQIQMRGFVLKTAVGIEAMLIVILLHCTAHQNTPKKESDEFKIKRLTFGEVEAKARRMLKKYHPDLHKQNMPLLNEIKKLVTFRNWFAHCPILWEDRTKGTFSIIEQAYNELRAK